MDQKVARKLVGSSEFPHFGKNPAKTPKISYIDVIEKITKITSYIVILSAVNGNDNEISLLFRSNNVTVTNCNFSITGQRYLELQIEDGRRLDFLELEDNQSDFGSM